MPPPNRAFLQDSQAAGTCRVAIFGKHPCAADHMQDIGLSSASLVAFKQGFYVEGIGECIARQAWAKDLGRADAPPFDHHLICVGPAGFIVARIRASADAAGRRQFPLVLACHGSIWDAGHLDPAGVILEAAAAQTATARQSHDLQALQAQLQAQAEEQMRHGAASQFRADRGRAWLGQMFSEGTREGLWRVFHALSPQGANTGRVRLPLVSGRGWEAVLWLSLLTYVYGDSGAVATILWRDQARFADFAMTPPNGRFLATLFSPESAVPLTTAVPYRVAGDLAAIGSQAVDEWLRAEAWFPGDGPPDGSTSSLLNKVCNGLRGWFKSTT